MGFAERAALLAGLGMLRQKGALKDDQFDRLKGNVLKNDKPITEAVLAILDSFWSLRCEGTLNDNEYREQLRGILGSLEEGVDLGGAARKSSSALVAPSLEAQQDEPDNTAVSETSAADDDVSTSEPPDSNNNNNSSSSSNSDNSSGSSSGGGGSAAAEDVADDDAVEAGGDSATPSASASASSPSAGEKRKLGEVSTAGGEGVETHGDAYAGGTPVKDEAPDFHEGPDAYERPAERDPPFEGIAFSIWRATDVFHFPGKSFTCDDGTIGRLVDTTAALLEKSEERSFPRLSEGCRSKSDSQRLYRQRKMYFVLKKVLVCDAAGGEQLVFRATRKEIENAVPEVADGKLSTEEYRRAVLKHVASPREP